MPSGGERNEKTAKYTARTEANSDPDDKSKEQAFLRNLYFEAAFLLDNGIFINRGVFRPIPENLLRERSSMSPSPAEATIESPSPPVHERAPEGPGPGGSGLKGPRFGGSWFGGSWFKGPVRGVIVAAVIALIVGTLVLASKRAAERQSTGSGAQSSSIPTHSSRTLRVQGTTEAVQARAILAPLLAGQSVVSLTIIRIAQVGTRVKRGDLLVEFDRQAQLRDFIDKQADHGKLVDQVLEEQAKEDAARAKDETEIKQAEDNLSKAELEMQKVEIDSRIDAEKAQENLDEAKATLQQLRETFGLKRKAAQAAIRILEIQRDRTRETMLHAQANSELMQIHSPIDGVVVLNTIWKQGKIGEVQEGDQVRPGVPFMQVVDPSKMQVRAPVNQEDFLSLRVGQTAKVYLDAYPQLVFPGKVEEMAPIGRNGDFSSKLRSFAVVFSIAGSDARLMPDLSAAADVDVAGGGSAAGGSQ
jgi:HlyD family secretion protein